MMTRCLTQENNHTGTLNASLQYLSQWFPCVDSSHKGPFTLKAACTLNTDFFF